MFNSQIYIEIKAPPGAGKTLIIQQITPILQNLGFGLRITDGITRKSIPPNIDKEQRGVVHIKTEQIRIDE